MALKFKIYKVAKHKKNKIFDKLEHINS